jgi:DNA-binding response OmpR family regulator
MLEYKIKKLKNYTILFAEDESGIRDEIKDILELLFKDIYMAKDGLEAKDLYLQYKPDIIITDIKMPKLTGIELIQYIRKEDDDTFIAIISAFTQVNLILQATELNLLKYIVKPITKTKLFEVFDKFLDKKLDQNIMYLDNDYILYKNKLYIKCKNTVYKLTHKELTFLNLLYIKKAIVTYDEIEDILENENFESQHHIRQFIKKLRGKLPKKYLSNFQGQGYILSPYLC